MINIIYSNPATKTPVVLNDKQLMVKYNLQKGDPIPKNAEIKFLKIDSIILTMFENVECESESRNIYGEVIHDIHNALKEKLDYIELTKQEAIDFQSIFMKTKIIQPQHNPLVLFIIQEFDKFIADFDSSELDTSKEQSSEIKN